MLSHFSGVRLFATQWTVARQAPLFMGFFRQKYWSGLPCPPSPGSFQTRDPNPLRYPALAGGFFTTSATWETLHCIIKYMRKKKKERKKESLICVWLFATPRTVARQAALSGVFSRQEYWSGLPIPSPGDLPDPGIKPPSPALQADSLPSKPPRFQHTYREVRKS